MLTNVEHKRFDDDDDCDNKYSASSLQPVDIAGDTKMLESGTKTRALLRFNVRRARLLFVTTIAGIIMTLVILLCAGAGINLGVVSRDRGSAGHKSLIDTYNSVSGVLVSATLAPIEMVLSMLAAVASLTFSSDFAVKRGLHSHLMIAALGAAMSFLVTNGLSALNVQLIPGDVVAMITIGNGKQPYVYAIGICANEDGSEDFRMNFSRANLRTRVFSDCNHRSNTSMLLVGVGKKVVGDSWDYDESSGSVKLGGVKSVYSITFGLLSWTVESLDKVFGATCVSNSNCRGVWYPLDPVHPESSDVLVIHEAKLPLDGLDYVALDYVWDEYGASTTSIGEKDWKRLLMLVGTETDSYDLLLPRRFLNVTPNAWAAQRNSEDCRWYWDTRKFIWVVEQNHLYAEESLQMTYTAGVFYLFGSAVRQKQLTNSSTLAFTGNTQPLRIQASIPRVNVIISLTGVVVTLAAAIGIAILHKRTSRKIERTADVEVVAEAMFNRAKYPPTFLSLSLHDIFDRAFPAEQEAFLQDLRVQHIELVSIAAEASSRTSTFTVNSSLA
ncbi:ribosome biogenesis protein tsr3 [Phytophthora boehmeriae]|uniref:Ribosome biogenesis protein tsr3 n=1 Tax=Phytophthora boehmeriae TaxID=109152 RepID=A0A8T1WMN7_9STRA|nr:ribosome biogenesis protein tsr3 [Phytophthora boehmeriae]